MVYSTQGAKDRALKEKIRKAKIQAKIKHPDVPAHWHRDETNNWKGLEKDVKDAFQKNLERQQQRREKLGERR